MPTSARQTRSEFSANEALADACRSAYAAHYSRQAVPLKVPSECPSRAFRLFGMTLCAALFCIPVLLDSVLR